MKNRENVRNSAEEKFKKKETHRLEGQKAMAEYLAVQRSVDANTARLRALRLARDSAEKDAAKVVKKTPRKTS
ncbi:MAG TPA: hypothetical protein VKT73_00115 [Xanthobacteraceae bacterium]|jgi:hypothetical protein|nr:hypothetical protein [Xanthobacteraceae bacterium]